LRLRDTGGLDVADRPATRSGKGRPGAAEARLEQTATAIAALTNWMSFLEGAPARGHVTSIGIFYREDGEWLSAKHLKEGRRESSVLASLEPLILARLEQRVLHEFSTSR